MKSLLDYALLAKSAYNGIPVCDHKYIVEQTKTCVYIAIAGTLNFENLFEDVFVWPHRTCKGAYAHAGVHRAFNELKDVVSRHYSPIKQICFIGHSLGGGIAQLFAEYYRCKVITFGSLKVYFRFKSTPRLTHIRVVCDDDPIVKVPGILYIHSCKSISLPDDDDELFDFGDHSLDYYIKQLQKRGDILC
jgi:hypothetical protein